MENIVEERHAKKILHASKVGHCNEETHSADVLVQDLITGFNLLPAAQQATLH